MIKQIKSFFDYIGWLYEKNHEFENSKSNIFRLINVKDKLNGEYELEVQVVNKTAVFHCGAAELAGQDKLLNGFSKSDIRAIIYFASLELAFPKNSIVAHKYNSESKKAFLSLKRKGLDQVLDVSLDEISANSETVKNLSQRDAYIAGYLSAIEGFKGEHEALNSNGSVESDSYDFKN